MIRIGVVGLGGMGQAHCNALAHVDICQLVAVSDLRADVTQEVASKFQVEGFKDCHTMFKHVDAIVVATPPSAHRETVVNAAQAGIHVFCEKPLSITLSDADAMINAADQNGVVFMVGQVLRFYPVHELGKEIVDSGEIGDLVYLETDYTSHYIGMRQRPSGWRGMLGGFLENGIHKADLINWFGGEAKYVSAEVGSFSGYEDWEDYAATLIRFKSEAIGILRWGPFMGTRGSRETILDGTKGSLRLDMGSDNVYRKLIGEEEWTELVPAAKGESGVVRELRHFMECIQDNKPPLADGRDGRRAVELVLASYRSAKEETKITLPLSE